MGGTAAGAGGRASQAIDTKEGRTMTALWIMVIGLAAEAVMGIVAAAAAIVDWTDEEGEK